MGGGGSLNYPHWAEFCANVLWRNVYNLSLWYVRDLILFTVLSPLIYILARRYPYVLIPLFVLHISNVDTVIASRGIFYFFLGAVCGMRRIDILAHIKPYKPVVLLVFVLGTILLPITSAWEYHSQLLYLYVPFAIGAVLLLMSDVMQKIPVLGHRFCSLSSSAFFIYVAHLVLILSLVRGRFYALGIGETVYGYFLIAFFVVLFSYISYALLRRYWPRLLGVLVGGRA